MPRHLVSLLLLFGIFPLILSVQASQSMLRTENGEKSAVFLSPKFVLGAGSVDNKFYYNIDFPRGHIALKEFNAEVVDELGNPVPLHETYLHHWIVLRYYAPKDAEIPEDNGHKGVHFSKNIVVRNSGICPGTLNQYFGLGSETRRTATYVPDPYGIEVGNPAEIPDGYEERWLLNVHAIDTRGVEDRLGCTECKCDLYNVTKDEKGQPLRPHYSGGLYCCYDETQCRVREGFRSVKRSLYLRYTVRWVDWEETIVPVKIYIFDVTDTGKRANDSISACQVEYEVEECGRAGVDSDGCIDNKKTSMVMPNGGNVIYGVAHQHTGGRGAALYGEDGRVICSSIPVYGEGEEVGNEAGYIVGMSTCYPQPGSIKISDGETLVLESNYSSTQKHTGVMGLFYILVADQPPKPVHMPIHMQESLNLFKYKWALVFMGVAVAIVVGIGYYLWRRDEKEGEYQPLRI
ncbi:Stress up-regulated Nod 19 [Macleaya cordata]|uniref:Stress up-regulated Nod 19 n=1 Tax=Macleaya cordata TaxID=56857 RepID=A0A200R3S5_MACCD|nr:Stress up-regulated Nod 19 [Macleaya cordata]